MNTDNRIERALARLRVPEGMEQRLSERIDALAEAHSRRRRRIIMRYASAAAVVAVIVAASISLQPRHASASAELTPEQVRYYTELALDKASTTMQKSGKGLRSTDQALNHITQTLRKI